MSNQFVALYHGEDGAKAIYVAADITVIMNVVTTYLNELFEFFSGV